jgi:hypothetical protein
VVLHITLGQVVQMAILAAILNLCKLAKLPNRSLKYKGSLLWNNLPISVQGHMPINDFKSDIYDFLFNKSLIT